MKRFHCLLLLFAGVLFTTLGCRRANENARQATFVAEGDFITAPNINDMSDMLRKREKKAAPEGETEEQAKERVAREKKEDDDREKARILKKQKSIHRVGEVYRDFAKSAGLSKITTDNMRQQLRRAECNDERQMVENKRIEIVFEADLSFPDHVLALWLESEGGGELFAVFANLDVSSIKENDWPQRRQIQTLQAVHGRYRTFVGQANQRNFDAFRTFMKDNAQPALAAPIEGKSIVVNMSANPNDPGQAVAARNQLIIGGEDGKTLKGFLTIMGDGSLRYLMPDVFQKVFGNQ